MEQGAGIRPEPAGTSLAPARGRPPGLSELTNEERAAPVRADAGFFSADPSSKVPIGDVYDCTRALLQCVRSQHRPRH